MAFVTWMPYTRAFSTMALRFWAPTAFAMVTQYLRFCGGAGGGGGGQKAISAPPGARRGARDRRARGHGPRTPGAKGQQGRPQRGPLAAPWPPRSGPGPGKDVQDRHGTALRPPHGAGAATAWVVGDGCPPEGERAPAPSPLPVPVPASRPGVFATSNGALTCITNFSRSATLWMRAS